MRARYIIVRGGREVTTTTLKLLKLGQFVKYREMLVFPQWRSEFPEDGCRVQRWMPAERFTPYLARPVPLPPLPSIQLSDEDSSGGSSPERTDGDISEGACGWRACGARFMSVSRLSAHVARTHAHAHQDGLFYCAWKGCARPHRGFNARYKMLVHVRTHTNERPHLCNQCHKSFSRAENLKIHLRSHSGEKPYVCPYEGCGKAYSNSSDRFKHTRTHSVEKPYCCKVPGCNKRYTDPSSLRKHVKTYKHFTTEQTRRESSEEAHSSDAFSPKESTPYTTEPTSPVHTYIAKSPPNIVYPRSTISPIAPYTITDSLRYTPVEHITYVKPLEPLYPVRVPSDEMSYVEYTQMYEHAYRNYYSNINYPVLRPNINEKVYTYEEQRVEEAPMVKESCVEDEMPLNLITKRLECRPIEALVNCTDYPLDLSNKS